MEYIFVSWCENFPKRYRNSLYIIHLYTYIHIYHLNSFFLFCPLLFSGMRPDVGLHFIILNGKIAASVAVSAWTLVVISVERYYAICHPLRSRRWQTLSHSYKLIAAIWCGSLVSMSPIAFFSRLIPISQGKILTLFKHFSPMTLTLSLPILCFSIASQLSFNFIVLCTFIYREYPQFSGEPQYNVYCNRTVGVVRTF